MVFVACLLIAVFLIVFILLLLLFYFILFFFYLYGSIRRVVMIFRVTKKPIPCHFQQDYNHFYFVLFYFILLVYSVFVSLTST